MLLPERPAVIARLSTAEREAIAAFREELQQPVDSVTALWFLRSRQFNVSKGVKMYMAHLAWRKTYGADELARTPPKASPKALAAIEAAFSPRLLRARDKMSRPVMFLVFSGLDLVALAAEGVTVDLLIRRYVHEMEKLRLAVGASPDPFAGHLQIIDGAGMSVAKFWKSWKFFMAMSKIGSENYPELLGCCCIVNGISSGAWVLEQVKHLLDPATASKIEMHVGDPRRALVKHLAPSEIPAELLASTANVLSVRKAAKEATEEPTDDASELEKTLPKVFRWMVAFMKGMPMCGR